MKRVIGIVMMCVGIFLIAYINLIKYKVNEKQEYMINAFEKTMQQVDKSGGIHYNTSNLVKKPCNNKELSKNKELNKKDNAKDVIGIIYIPKINLKAAISEGVEAESLKYAVGHFLDTPLPEEKGNFCLAGHRSYTYGEFFNRLDELQIGDEITIETYTSKYKYKVYEKKVVEPSEVSVLDNTKTPIITLVTCTPIRVATHRLIIKGKLI